MGEEGAESQLSSRARGRPRGRGRGTAPAGTPRARGRGRGRARGRAKGKGLAGRPSQDDGEGEGDEGGDEEGRPWRRVGDRIYYIEGDEFVTEPDEKGDQKIDIDGVLQGGEIAFLLFVGASCLSFIAIGRRFKCSTFVLPARHPTRHYMLAIDAARSSGFRDSLYYFRKNSLALKLSATQPEKELLIQAGKLGAHLKTRSVTLVTARSAYKLHGAKMIIDGCWVTDDYYEDRAIQDVTARGILPGSPVGELPDPTATSSSNLPANTLPAQASSGISHGVYRAGGPTTLFGSAGLGPFSDGPHSAVRKSMLSREGLSSENWMAEAARRVSEMNDIFAKMRRETRVPCGGILDGDAKAKLKEQLANEGDDGDGTAKKKRKADHSQFPLGVYEPHTGIVCYTQPTRCRWEQVVQRRVLGGTKVGNGAWALAWVDTCLDLPGPKGVDPGEDERAALMASTI
ncbi:chromatin remodelling complex Rsc7/Swp82 subunit-domain-containing protein [Scleroderma citrinum]